MLTKETTMLDRLILILTETLAIIGTLAIAITGMLLLVGFGG